jgi:hypothetical protein
MSLDYSKLTDDELEAIANDDYSKLSDRTLRQLSSDPTAKEPSISVAPQAASSARPLGALAIEGAQAVPGMLKQGVQTVANMPYQTAARGVVDIGSMMAGHPPYGSMFKMGTDAVSGTPLKEVAGNAINTIKSGAGAIGGGLANFGRNVGSAVVQGALAPESAFLMPYQMAAYEQEKIRQNPSAPGLETNPYAQTVRGEAATQGQAGAMNARNAVANMPFGNVTPQERMILEQDQRDRQQRQARQAQARATLAQPPTAQNFIARSQAMADLYGGVGK